VRHALWLGGLLVILGGLFGMHGLDDHGGAGMDSIAHATMTGPVAQGAAVAHEVMTGVVHEAAAVINTSGHAGMGMGAAGMCMAVLMLSLLVLMLQLHASRQSQVLWLVARPVRATGIWGRDPDPPSLFRLSIQRC